jgi:hypothetical protein
MRGRLPVWLRERRAKGDTLLELSLKIHNRYGILVSQQSISNWLEEEVEEAV